MWGGGGGGHYPYDGTCAIILYCVNIVVLTDNSEYIICSDLTHAQMYTVVESKQLFFTVHVITTLLLPTIVISDVSERITLLFSIIPLMEP